MRLPGTIITVALVAAGAVLLPLATELGLELADMVQQFANSLP